MTSSNNPPPNARFSTYSAAPSIQPSLAPTYNTTAGDSVACPSSKRTSAYLLPSSTSNHTSTLYTHNPASSTTIAHSTDPRAADIKSWSGTLERMRDPCLDAQRFVMNENKTDEFAKLALSAKVERALARRMVGQDATLKPSKKAQVLDEKRAWEMRAR